ncbi:hypothetical protein GOP47_0006505 [Adiantum capillus-veneris]|uniref:Uncharacterized protein n=1 Tax=Adiantum capillus-veneris TaxID=13818 RepID=A0A9D4ZKG7_ADICA|nr:hypothetical protein GOP47_0006505 [Adiantum capillus-veneris]
MGLFSFGRRKPLPRSEQALAEISDLGRVILTLDSNRLIYENGHWTADFVEGPIAAPDGSLEKEIIELRREKRKLWSMRVLDNERGSLLDKDGPLSPGRSSKRNSLALSSH